MTTFLAYAKMLAPMVMAVVTALTPFYGKDAWYVGVIAAAGAINLLAPSVLPAKTPAPTVRQ